MDGDVSGKQPNGYSIPPKNESGCLNKNLTRFIRTYIPQQLDFAWILSIIRNRIFSIFNTIIAKNNKFYLHHFSKKKKKAHVCVPFFVPAHTHTTCVDLSICTQREGAIRCQKIEIALFLRAELNVIVKRRNSQNPAVAILLNLCLKTKGII